MIYRSNLTCPDLTGNFKHMVSRPMGHSFGHDVPSDWGDKAVDDPVFGIYKNCGMWTHDEAAILFNVAKLLRRDTMNRVSRERAAMIYRSNLTCPDLTTHDEVAILFNVAKRLRRDTMNLALDIGAHTGWTTAHMLAAGVEGILPLEPMAANDEFFGRFIDNVGGIDDVGGSPIAMRSDQYFGSSEANDEFFGRFIDNVGGIDDVGGSPIAMRSDQYFGSSEDEYLFDLVVIDGDHDPPVPLNDAKGSFKNLNDTGVILLHDFIGKPVREATQWLRDQGMNCRIYFTPHVIACCWRGDFNPPGHVPDPDVVIQLLDGRMNDFDFNGCE